jgi:CelD/BcsL family acetyltransferase involved in cellulose biosynthesis
MVAVTSLPSVAVLDGAHSFAGIREEWNELLRSSDADCPFLTWEWLNTWWTHLAAGSGLRVILIRAGSTLIAAAPLRVTRSLGVFPQLEFLGTGNAGSDYLDVIVRRGFEAEGLNGLASALDAQGMALKLRNLPARSGAADVSRRLASRGWTRCESQIAVCPIITLSNHTWESYLAALGAAHRANVRRRLRALETKFDLGFHRVDSDAERADALRHLFRFHAVRWGARSTAFTTDRLRRFHEEVTRLALDEGWLSLYVMTLKGDVAGVMYGFTRGDTFYFYQHACDERYQSQSAGLVLMALTIRAAINDGIGAFDLLYGSEAYKSHWAHDHRPLMSLELFPARLRGALHRRTRDAERTVRSLARRVLGGHRAA